MRRAARDVMNRTVFAIRDDTTVEELAAFLIEKDVSGAPVVNATGRLVGVVTTTDLVEDRNESGENARLEGRVSGWRDKMSAEDLSRLHVKSEGRLVRDIMTPAVYTIPEDLPIPEVARTMVTGHVHRLFVTRHGEVIGMVSALDLLKLLYESEETTVAKQDLVASGG